MCQALPGVVRGAKRNKAFENTRWIGWVLDGAGGIAERHYALCHPVTNAPFLHRIRGHGLHVVTRLKDNLPTFFKAARQRFEGRSAHQTFTLGTDRDEVWDADDFNPWETLSWSTVRALRYRQY